MCRPCGEALGGSLFRPRRLHLVRIRPHADRSVVDERATSLNQMSFSNFGSGDNMVTREPGLYLEEITEVLVQLVDGRNAGSARANLTSFMMRRPAHCLPVPYEGCRELCRTT